MIYELRFILRDGKRILQQLVGRECSCCEDWVDVPLHEEEESK